MAAPIPGGLWMPSPIAYSVAPGHNTLLIDASAEKAAWVFTVPKSGVLDKFEFRTGTVINNPDNGLRISFQDLNSAGDPDGGQDQYRDIPSGSVTSNTWITPGLMTSDGTDTGSKRTVVAGQRLAVVIEFPSFVAGDQLFISYNVTVANSFQDIEEFSDHFIAAWTHESGGGGGGGTICGALKYETDGYYPISDTSIPALTWNNLTLGNATSPDEIALRFMLPVDLPCDGGWCRGDLDGDGDFILYDSDGTSVLASFFHDASQRGLGGGIGNMGFRWPAVDLLANTAYRLAFKPSTATTGILYTFTTNSAALMGAVVGGVEWYRSSRTDGGSWTDTTTERPLMGLHVPGIVEAADGSPGGGSPGSGGFETGFATIGG